MVLANRLVGRKKKHLWLVAIIIFPCLTSVELPRTKYHNIYQQLFLDLPLAESEGFITNLVESSVFLATSQMS